MYTVQIIVKNHKTQLNSNRYIPPITREKKSLKKTFHSLPYVTTTCIQSITHKECTFEQIRKTTQQLREYVHKMLLVH